MILVAILLGTLAAGIGSVWVAAALSFGVLARYTQHMLSLAAGALLATAFMHLLPEAFESQASAHDLFLTLLVGLVFFFLLDKAELWHHGHEHHHGADHAHDHSHDHASDHGSSAKHASEHRHGHHHAAVSPKAAASIANEHNHSHARSGAWAVLAGDSVHCFGDGILIASAFIADLKLGVIAALAVLAHEVPHHMGDLAVLRGGGRDRRAAVVKVSLAGAVTALGGVLGYFLVARLEDWLPYFLAIASSSFIYVALADLIPQLQKRLSARETAAQIGWLLAGIGLVTAVSGLAHAH